MRTKRSVQLLTIAGLTALMLGLPVAASASGAASAAGGPSNSVRADFNGDGITDLAIGVPYEDVNGQTDAGAVQIIYGSAAGLAAGGNQFWTQDSAGVLDLSETGDHFGTALAVGDYNGDQISDLAIGIPGEDMAGLADAGAVAVLYGSAAGLTAAGNQLWTQDSAGVLGVAGVMDHFGSALASGRFGPGPFVVLAIGVPDETGDVGAIPQAGAVNVLYGTAAGLNAAGNQLWTQNSAGILGMAGPGDRFGAALAAGPITGNPNQAALAIGVPQETFDVGGILQAGAVNLLYSGAAGLGAVGNQLWSQDSPGVLGTAGPFDHFGTALAVGTYTSPGGALTSFDGNPFADLAIGVPDETVNSGALNAGAVNVLYSAGAGGLMAAGNQLWQQNSAGVLDVSEQGDRFGYALAASNFDGDEQADLAIGVPQEDLGAIVDAGAVQVLYGAAGGLSAAGNQQWTQNSAGILGAANANDYFGSALTANTVSSFNGDGFGDLAIGVPEEDVNGIPDAGAVNVIYGSAAGLAPAGNQLWTQDSPGILDLAEMGDVFGASLATR